MTAGGVNCFAQRPTRHIFLDSRTSLCTMVSMIEHAALFHPDELRAMDRLLAKSRRTTRPGFLGDAVPAFLATCDTEAVLESSKPRAGRQRSVALSLSQEQSAKLESLAQELGCTCAAIVRAAGVTEKRTW